MTTSRRKILRWLPLVAATAFLAYRSIGSIYAKLGHPGAALDDAYIHFQYARAFAEGHPFRFQAGEPISTGATSFLWPFVLAPFYLVGFRGETILWATWLLSFAALGALAWETYALAKPLTGRGAALGAGAMTLAFGGLVWGAASGMEVVPFAWLIATGTRRAAEWAEGTARTKRDWRILLGLAVVLPLMRPEGAITSIAMSVVVAVFPLVRTTVPKRALGAIPLLAVAFLPQILLLLLTGSPTSSTAQVKLLFGNPFYPAFETAFANGRILVGQILNGDVWSAEFLPKGGASVACLGLVAIAWRGQLASKYVRASLILLFAFSMFVPCFYYTFLWNRLRYLWPFAPGWFVGLACIARTIADLVGRIDRKWAPATAVLIAGGFAGTLAVRLEWVIEDVAQSASGIDRQQVWLGRWAKTALPADARIGVNDTGAVAYFSGRKTFDVVGLTTPTEGRYWVAGQGSRFEHYERLHQSNPSALPTHFIVYPEWMACTPLLGATLTEATVTDSTILGGQTMRAMEAKWDHLGSGELPWTPLKQLDDTIDVADLESEKEHGFTLVDLREGDETVEEGNAPNGDIVDDGGRTNRLTDHFTANTTGGTGVMRIEVSTESASIVKVSIGGNQIAAVRIEPGEWIESSFDIPPDARKPKADVEISAEARFTSFHYWFGKAQ